MLKPAFWKILTVAGAINPSEMCPVVEVNCSVSSLILLSVSCIWICIWSLLSRIISLISTQVGCS